MAKRTQKTEEQVIDYTQLVPQNDVTQEVTTEAATATAVEQKTDEQMMAELDAKHGSVKSKMIRELAAAGRPTKEIVKLMQLVYPKFIYQHARNVLNQPLKKQEA